MDDPLNQQSPNINARLYISLFESLVLFTDKIMFGFVTFVFFFILDIKVVAYILIFILKITLRRTMGIGKTLQKSTVQYSFIEVFW